MTAPRPNFLGLDLVIEDRDAVDASRHHHRVAVLPVPLERTVSYGGGTALGPRAILEASTQVELHDEVAGDTPADALEIVTLDTVALDSGESEDPGAAIDRIETAAFKAMTYGVMTDGAINGDRFVVCLGGEHSLTTGPVRAARRAFGDLGVVQFDAHADLRDSYEGSIWSHASVMKRIHDLGIPTAAVGIRSLSAPESELIRERCLPTLWGHELADDRIVERFDALLETLPDQVYLTFDLDFFDPSLLPATGTPEPGGGDWWPTLRLLERLFSTKRVVAMDIVELAPIPGQPASDFVAARLAYKCIGYQWRAARGRV